MFAAGGAVYVWGDNSEGQLGLGEDVPDCDEPVELEMDEKVKQVSCGYYHTALVTGESAGTTTLLCLQVSVWVLPHCSGYSFRHTILSFKGV